MMKFNIKCEVLFYHLPAIFLTLRDLLRGLEHYYFKLWYKDTVLLYLLQDLALSFGLVENL